MTHCRPMRARPMPVPRLRLASLSKDSSLSAWFRTPSISASVGANKRSAYCLIGCSLGKQLELPVLGAVGDGKMAAGSSTGGSGLGDACRHHAQLGVCESRAKYREGRRPRAVKVGPGPVLGLGLGLGLRPHPPVTAAGRCWRGRGAALPLLKRDPSWGAPERLGGRGCWLRLVGGRVLPSWAPWAPAAPSPLLVLVPVPGVFRFFLCPCW